MWEEPIIRTCNKPELEVSSPADNLYVLTPVLPEHLADEKKAIVAQRALLNTYLAARRCRDFIAWYYTPMALRFSDHLSPAVTVYDCMDELSAFQGAPPALVGEEKRLFDRADVVFAGGAGLYAAKRTQHDNVHLVPSSVDCDHFAAARKSPKDPPDQSAIPRPRIGFYGVLDERLDRELLRDVAAMHPEMHFILIGPVVKIQPEDLPQAPNLHYLGQKTYSELPAYLGNWDVAMLPFARNASTRFISPTKTPEYLAGGKPVVSTPIQDVVKPYGEMGLVRIGATANEFANAILQLLRGADERWLQRVDEFLGNNSWDATFGGMQEQIQQCMVLSSR